MGASKSDVVVIGMGNEMRADDGFGVHAARRLRGRLPADVEVVEGGTCAADLLPYVEGRRLVVMIDAIDAGEEPGTLFRFTPEQVKPKSSPTISLHDFGLYDLVTAARLMGRGPGEVIIIAAQAGELGLGWELTPPLRRALDRMEELVLAELERVRREPAKRAEEGEETA